MHVVLTHHFFLTRAIYLLAHYGYGVLFPIAVIEGPVAAMVAGALTASNEFNGVVVFVLLVLADLTGDTIYYALGRWGHDKLLASVGRYVGLTPKRIEPLRESFKKNDWKVLVIGKTQAFGSVILYFAGAVRMDFGRYIFFNLLVTLPKILLFELIGYFFGESLIRSARYLDYITFIMLAAAIALFAIYWFSKGYLARRIDVPTSFSEET